MNHLLDDALEQELIMDCQGHLADAQQVLMDLAADCSETTTSQAYSLFRHLHSVKGAAGYLGNEGLRELSHLAESVLLLVRDGRRGFDAKLVATLWDASEGLNALLRNPQASARPASQKYLRAILGAEANGQAPSPQPRTKRTIRSLVVEDELTSRILLGDFLHQFGECHIAVNGREACEAFGIAQAARRPYDLICLDIRMPEMDGLAAIQEIRRMEAAQGIRSTLGARIVMTTAVSDIRSVLKAFNELCDAYLFKPLDIARLQSHLRSFNYPS